MTTSPDKLMPSIKYEVTFLNDLPSTTDPNHIGTGLTLEKAPLVIQLWKQSKDILQVTDGLFLASVRGDDSHMAKRLYVQFMQIDIQSGDLKAVSITDWIYSFTRDYNPLFTGLKDTPFKGEKIRLSFKTAKKETTRR